MSKCKTFLVSILILKLSYVLAAVTKRYECKLEDVVKKRGNKTLKCVITHATVAKQSPNNG